MRTVTADSKILTSPTHWQHDEPAETSELEKASERYRRQLAWPVELRDGAIVLPLISGMAAVSAPIDVVAPHLLAGPDVFQGPVLLGPADPPRAYVLAESAGLVISQADLPDGLRFHTTPEVLVLPPGTARGVRLGWLRAPAATRRWLPPAKAVITALAGPPGTGRSRKLGPLQQRRSLRSISG
jgi:hypothetical protein